jgi:hypothetical protein
MSRNTLLLLAVLASMIAGGCTDQPLALAPDGSMTPAPTTGAPADPREALARTLALALRSPVLRAYLRAKLQMSPFREHKVQFQRFLTADGQHALLRIAGETATPPAAVAGAATAAIPLEIYLPVPAHRSAWMGDGRVLVATEISDSDTPVAYDTAGNRYLLSPDTPPAIPVLALVPVETDFSTPPSAMMCMNPCGGGGSGGGSPAPPPAPAPGLYMSQAHFTQTFESWLKGAPEFEVHILGQKGQTDSLTDYQCAGEHQPAPYYFDQNSLDWSSSVMLFSQAQLDDYRTKHAGQNIRVYVVEDDDTACQIKTDGNQLAMGLAQLDSIVKGFGAGKDTVTGGLKQFQTAQGFLKLLSVLGSLINTNDDLVGNAVADSVAGESHPGFNWIVKGTNNVTNGWIKLEMR